MTADTGGPLFPRCQLCGSRDRVERDSTGDLACYQCFVPDLTADRYQVATEDVLVAPPNARNVTPLDLWYGPDFGPDPDVPPTTLDYVTESEARLLDGDR